MKTIIAGSRSIRDEQLVFNILKNLPFKISELIHGGAKGVDEIAGKWGKLNGILVTEFLAKWNDINVKGAIIKIGKYGKYNAAAGVLRNREMAEYVGQTGHLVLIWDGQSNGSANMLQTAKSLGIKISEFIVKE